MAQFDDFPGKIRKLGSKSPFSRRDFLLASLGAGAGAALLSSCSSSTPSAATTTTGKICAPPNGLSQIDHIVILIQENRSFDHYFGTYPGVNGFSNQAARTAGIFEQNFSANSSVAPIGKLLPFHLDTINATNSMCVNDITHAWGPQHQSWDNGKMDGFGSAHLSADGPANALGTMGYYERADLPYYYALADSYTICDAYHCSVLGPTHPNRLMALSGTIDPSGKNGGPVVTTQGSLSYEGSAKWTTMPDQLSAKGITWKTYQPSGSLYAPGTSLGALASDNILLYFPQFLDSGSEKYKLAFEEVFPDDFQTDVQTGNLPQVSWIVASDPASEHPPAPPVGGEQVVNQVITTLMSNPSVWAKTALFITYDENGGFFDHVTPPTPPPGTKDEYLTVSPIPSDASGTSGPIGLGFRVPMLVVSPFSAGGYVCSEIFDHTSTLRFIESRFGVEVPNLSQWRRDNTGDLTSAFDFGNSNTSAPSLPPISTSVKSMAGTTDCSIGTVIGAVEPLAMPSVQSVPDQETGMRKKRPPAKSC